MGNINKNITKTASDAQFENELRTKYKFFLENDASKCPYCGHQNKNPEVIPIEFWTYKCEKCGCQWRVEDFCEYYLREKSDGVLHANGKTNIWKKLLFHIILAMIEAGLIMLIINIALHYSNII